jgi:5'-deoxynucleotidase YfbR-like HD superfamily hydrolase
MQRVYELITWHDIDEIETGDIVGYHKTEEDRKREEKAKRIVVASAPRLEQAIISDFLAEYQAQQTPEAKFVKAIDKIDPVFMILNENGRKICNITPMTEDQHTRIKLPYLVDYPYMLRFFEVTRDELRRGGFFTGEPTKTP